MSDPHREAQPEGAEVREPQSAAAPGPAGPESAPESAPADSATDAELEQARQALVERTADLQRLQAEYVNYKRRVDRDRELTRQLGTEAVLRDLLDVLDGVSSARAHGELTGGIKGVADSLEKVANRYGLEAYGAKGDPFDPKIHEALMHAHAEGITGPTCVEVLQVGYKIKDKVLRPARVAVAEPGDDPAPDEPPSPAEDH